MRSITRKIRKYFLGHGILFHVIATIIWIWALSLLYVLLRGFAITFLDGRDYAIQPNNLFEVERNFKNYATAIKTLEYNDTGYIGMIVNSIWYSVGCTLARLLATTLSAYIVARYNFFGKKAFYAFLLLQMMVPIYGSGIANYNLLLTLGLIDSPLFLFSQFAGHGFNFFILHSFFSNMSPAYAESARIDGANDFQIFWKIMLPLAKASIAAIGITVFVSLWNDYNTPLIYLDSYPTLMTGLFRYKTIAAYTLDIPTYFAGVFMAALPIFILFVAFNKVLLENLTLGGLKG